MTPRSHRAPASRWQRRLVLAGAALAMGAVGAFAGISMASADNPGSECTGTAPDENGHVTLDCVIPMPLPTTITETTPVPVPTTITETVTTTVTQTVSASPTATQPPTSTTPAPTTTSPAPTTTAPPTTPPGPTVHGKDINATNTGPQAGACPDGMQVFTSKQRASTLGSRSCVDLRGGLTPDAAITLQQSLIRGQVDTRGARLTLRYVTVDAASAEWAIGGHVDCYRCQLINGSDGVRFAGTNIVESYVRVRSISSQDHNDGVQAYLASEGGTILRSNIDTRPVNASNSGNAAIFIADNSRGLVVIRDNWLGGGGYTLRLHESATYRVTGNILSGWQYGPCSTTNAIPGAFLEWADNRTSDGRLVNP